MPEPVCTGRLHIVEGRPWKDALISLLAPSSPYRPWRHSDDVHVGDAVVAVLDTDPRTVLGAVARVGADGDVGPAIADMRYSASLLELSALEMLLGREIGPFPGLVSDNDAGRVVAALDGCGLIDSAAQFGHTSMAAARVLLDSDGRCTGCGADLALGGADARDEVYIHTADALELAEPHFGDWPAVLCGQCRERMSVSGFTNFLQFRLARHPRCPRCSGQRTRPTLYGLLAGPPPPWVASMGCCIDGERLNWSCGVCGHEW